MRIDIITLFPEMFKGPFDFSIIKRAREEAKVNINLVNLREFSRDKHRQVDDYPYGGGKGMVIKPEPVFQAVESLVEKREKTKILLLCPQGHLFNQEKAKELAGEEHLVMICGHYEGVDERVRENLVDEDISIGDYVLTGGEIPAMVVTDALVRLLPGVLSSYESVQEESFYEGLLEYPHYTRPEEFRGLKVPGVLLSGDHGKIRWWRRKQALARTLKKRPELLNRIPLEEEDKKILRELALDS
ncbi:MAG: tRNA (guanosine(37)-N1)-methyltransferase TrmD [Candidatus Syntrophonatronum acetioxidans]|uniref:tRNA (guanine-N(1)-)-methyltransferase n=1 Tax=Candidatus Syntrophonatronum acetioxidans TaxID=1795816 RepID=A0A424YBR2_9FIRM|nr:MAG: tRNA (guanosine(37)-N1)-methyltransferase TrmD [Candidatus Syntrophonatronum acetioxidans]